MKGTSDKKEKMHKLERVMDFVRVNDSAPTVNAANLGRSSQLNQINHTLHNHFSYRIT